MSEMQLSNPFVLPSVTYQRDVDIFKHYISQSGTYLAKMTGRPLEECIDFVRQQLRPGGQFPFKDPKAVYLERQENGDRIKQESGFYQYLTSSIKNRDAIAPTFTTYLHPSVKKSLLATYIANGKKRRNKAKKEMFAADMAKDVVLYAFKKQEQTNAKQKNNSLSGAHSSSSTPLYNKTAHSSLTSTCRSTSGYGNANNEKFLAGNRHYWSPMIVMNNIVSIISNSNYAEMEATIQKYQLVIPSVDDVMNCIQYSTKLYWINEHFMGKVRALVEKLNGLERAAFVYTGDLYHLRELNPEVVRKFVLQLAKRVGSEHPDPNAVFKQCFEDQRNLAIVVCSHVTKGIDPEKLKEHPHAYAVTASTIENIYGTIQEYGDFIKTFFVTENVPASMAYFPESLRRVALTSDTDSTIFTAQEWVEWATGKIGFRDEDNNLSSTMIYLASASITHVLARMSANLGVDNSMVHAIAMKNEFKFDIFTPTQVAKHYFAFISSQEGKVYDKFKEEIKGVHLKNSNVPKEIIAKAKAMMLGIMSTVMKEEMIDLKVILKEIGDIERRIISSITSGSHDFFRYSRINSKDSYQQDEDRSNYRHYLMWREVFAPYYGEINEPPYTCLKMATNVDSIGKTKDWLASLENQELADRMRVWMKKYNKNYLGSVLLPEPIVSSNGIPKELLQAVDLRRMILDSTNVFYIIAETLGVYMLNDKKSKLISDYY
jgi:hypothetical protein